MRVWMDKAPVTISKTHRLIPFRSSGLVFSWSKGNGDWTGSPVPLESSMLMGLIAGSPKSDWGDGMRVGGGLPNKERTCCLKRFGSCFFGQYLPDRFPDEVGSWGMTQDSSTGASLFDESAEKLSLRTRMATAKCSKKRHPDNRSPNHRIPLSDQRGSFIYGI